MKEFNFDYEIIKSFIPENDKKSFLVFENVYFSYDGTKIIAPYRAPFSEKLSIDLIDYQNRLNQKLREEKLNIILKFEN
jgi:hypothetical protein